MKLSKNLIATYKVIAFGLEDQDVTGYQAALNAAEDMAERSKELGGGQSTIYRNGIIVADCWYNPNTIAKCEWVFKPARQ